MDEEMQKLNDANEGAENTTPVTEEAATGAVVQSKAAETLPSDNIFTPEDREKKEAEKQLQNMEDKKKIKVKHKFHWWIILPIILLAFLRYIFISWQLQKPRILNIALVNKTVLTRDDEEADLNMETLYRKHQGFHWIVNQQKYVFENGEPYDYKKDYFGTMLDSDGKFDYVTELSSLSYRPDLVYIADLYGAIDDTYGYYQGAIGTKGSGFTSEDMMVTYAAHEAGAMVIAEMETFHTSLSSAVQNQLQSLMGVTSTGWVGRYVDDLADLTDVPDWAPVVYFEQEGVEWQFSGAGIILVSSEKGLIIVLEEKTDFESANCLKIYINSAYKEEFKNCESLNFYNWFELVTANNGTEVLATFEFDVNATGMEKLKEFNSVPRFAAITRKNYKDGAPCYYFAGDFNDYVSQQNNYQFTFADWFYRLTTYEKTGDITNFYWNFYAPLMKVLLEQAYKEAPSGETVGEEEEMRQVSIIRNHAFQLLDEEGNPSKFPLKAVSINAVEPGGNGYSTNRDYYQKLIAEAASLGANCIYVKDLLPVEFYSALYENNKNPGHEIYIIQGLRATENFTGSDCTKEVAMATFKKYIEHAVISVHGKAIAGTVGFDGNSYRIDVSNYILSFVLDMDIDNAFVTSFYDQGYTYNGTHTQGDGLFGVIAMAYDTLQTSYQKYHDDKLIPIGVTMAPNLIPGTAFAHTRAFDLSRIMKDDSMKNEYLYPASPLSMSSAVLNGKTFVDVTGAFNKYAYALSELMKVTEGQVLITGISNPIHMTGFTDKHGNTEKEQGTWLVTMLRSVDNAGFIGGVIYDLNDNWTDVSDDHRAFAVPQEANKLWHDVTDPQQMTGLVSVEQATPSANEMVLADDDRMQHMYFSSSSEYLYITLQLLYETEYQKEALCIGIDTFQRNDGEYYYGKDYVATSISGMEYVIEFTDRQTAKLWVNDSYNRSKGGYKTEESYNGNYSLVTELVYGGFGATQNQFYQTGATIYIRIPWLLLNVTNPAGRMCLNNAGQLKAKANVSETNGIIFSVMIADLETKDVLYQFPENKNDPGYKTFKWAKWEQVRSYTLRERDAFNTIGNYFASK